jgi:hypothetical protein
MLCKFCILLFCILNQIIKLTSYEVTINEFGDNFLLDVDGISVSTGREHICALEQIQGNNNGEGIGGRIHCWGWDSNGRLNAPQDVCFLYPKLTTINN